MSPQRIQRRRTKGWRTPMCSCGCGKPARYIGRPGPFGNPFAIGKPVLVESFRPEFTRQTITAMTRGDACWWFGAILTPDYSTSTPTVFEPPHAWMDVLRGHDLMCWCPLDQPCHADILLELANREVEP